MKQKSLAIVLLLALAVAVFGWPPFTGTPRADGVLDDGYTNWESGVQRQLNGVYKVSALTRMPGVSAEMVRWWFGDYMQTTEHYKRWFPGAHLWMDWENKVPGEYIGASHLVHEYVGTELLKLRIQFVPPQEILGDVTMQAGDVPICARVGLLEQAINVAQMCHIVRDTKFGAEMRSRFWMGLVNAREGNELVGSIEGVLGNTYLARMIALRESDAVDLMSHAMQEMGILADFLPELYAQESGKTQTSNDQQQ